MLVAGAAVFPTSASSLVPGAPALRGTFELPLIFDLGAVFFFAFTGALAAIRRGYDWIGMFILAFVTGFLRIIVNHDFPRPGSMTVARRPSRISGFKDVAIHCYRMV